MIRFFLFIFLLIHSPAFAGSYVNSAKWSGKDAGYNDCGFTGFICTMYTKNVKTNRNSVSLGQNLKVYANGKEIDSFEVKRIYYDSSKGQCWISKERKKKFKTYFATFGCRGK